MAKSAYEQYPLSGFPFGLNTAVDETLLDPKYSPHMLNVSVSDTNAIVTRRGYREHSVDTGVTATIKALYRFYNGTSSAYWLYVSGTQVMSVLDVNGTAHAAVPESTKDYHIEEEPRYASSNVRATYGSNVYSTMNSGKYGYRGLAAVILDKDCTLVATVPDCNYLTVQIPSLSASVQLNNEGWVSVAGTSQYKPVVSNPGAQTVKVKPSVETGHSLKIVTADPSSTVRAWTRADLKTIPTISKNISVKFYDTGTINKGFYFEFTDTTGRYFVGMHYDYYTSQYGIFKSGNTTPLGKTTRGRTMGWHTVFIDVTTGKVYIDDELIYTYSYLPFTSISLTTVASAGSSFKTGYFDDLYVDDVLLDDFSDGNLTEWDAVSGGVASDGSISIDDTYCATYFSHISNTKCLKLTTATPTTGNSYARAHFAKTIEVPKHMRPWDVAEYKNRLYQVSFYDLGSNYASAYMGLVINGYSFYVGINNSQNSSEYSVFNTYNSTPVVNIGRSTAWHTITYTEDGDSEFSTPHSFYIDGTLLWTIPDDFFGDTPIGSVSAINLYGHAIEDHGSQVAYFDRFMINKVMVDDFENTWNWTLEHGGGSASWSNVSTYYVTGNVRVPLVFDCITYGYKAASSGKIDTIATTAEHISFIALDKSAYYATELNPLRKYDGAVSASITVATSAPSGGFLVENKGRAFISGDVVEPTLVTFSGVVTSATGTADDWTIAGGGGVLRPVARHSDAPCTGMAVHNRVVYYFSYSRTAALVTEGDLDSDWYVKDISMTHGCIAPKTIAVGDKGVVFLAADGVRAVGPLQSIFANDGTGLSMLSHNIVALNRERKDTDGQYLTLYGGYTAAQRKAAVGAYYDKRYWLFIGDGDCYVADLDKQTDNKQPVWVQYKFPFVATSAFVTRGDEYGLYVGTADGKILHLDNGWSDMDSSIDWFYETPIMPIGGTGTQKYFRTVYVGAKVLAPFDVFDTTILDRSLFKQEFTLTTNTDQTKESFHTHTNDMVTGAKITATLTSDVQPLRIPVSTSGRALKLVFSGKSKKEYDTPISIPYAMIDYGRPRKR